MTDLFAVFSRRLPTLSTEATRVLGDINATLASLPAPVTSEPSSFILGLVTSFCNEVRTHVQGQSDAAELVQATHKVYRKFKIDIRATAPPFLPLVDQNTGSHVIKQDLQELMSVDENGHTAQDSLQYIYLRDVRERIAK